MDAPRSHTRGSDPLANREPRLGSRAPSASARRLRRNFPLARFDGECVLIARSVVILYFCIQPVRRRGH